MPAPRGGQTATGQRQCRSNSSSSQSNSRSRFSPKMRTSELCSLLAAFCAILSIPTTFAQTATSKNSIPRIDFEALGGSLSVAGSFAGLQLFTSSDDGSGPSSNGFVGQPSNSTSTSSGQGMLLMLDEHGHATRLVGVDGTISALAECGTSDSPSIYIGGTFSDANGQTASNIAVYHPSNSSVTTIPQGGLDGPVTALACDGNTLYIGGSFQRPSNSQDSNYLGGVALYDSENQQYSPIGFGGFRGDNVEILSIAINDLGSEQDKSIIFGGAFSTYWLNDSSIPSGQANISVIPSSNGTVILTPSNGTVHDGETVEVFPSLGSSLNPISLANAEITSSASTSDSRFSDPKNVFCPPGEDGSNGSTWLARQGDQSSRITARMFAPLSVGGFRIGNTRQDGSGSQTFRYAQPTSTSEG